MCCLVSVSSFFFGQAAFLFGFANCVKFLIAQRTKYSFV